MSVTRDPFDRVRRTSTPRMMGDYAVVLPPNDPASVGRASKSESIHEAQARLGWLAMQCRASAANAWRRRDRGEPVAVCADRGCGCELDVTAPAHAPRCKAAA